jgi:hypothetical protein
MLNGQYIVTATLAAQVDARNVAIVDAPKSCRTIPNTIKPIVA